uniref:Dimethylargininase n=1 Tax=Timema cristinae TaxID=61476 RepID=A0A7R9GXB7_TIMCR|nr:unnamed protein product [Timema cristinae]
MFVFATCFSLPELYSADLVEHSVAKDASLTECNYEHWDSSLSTARPPLPSAAGPILQDVIHTRQNREGGRGSHLEAGSSCENMASLKFTHAVVCRIPLSFRTRGEIELEEAKRQHEAYVRLLRELGLDVIELPPDETLPECMFVEDTAIVCNGLALITRPGAQNRAKEVETIRAVLKKELDLPIVEIGDESAKLDGGDVLFTGREFFVGLSEWTNEAGARAVAAAFPEFPCTPVKVRPCVDPEESLDLETIQVRCMVSR